MSENLAALIAGMTNWQNTGWMRELAALEKKAQKINVSLTRNEKKRLIRKWANTKRRVA